jgi:hypothetical protein
MPDYKHKEKHEKTRAYLAFDEVFGYPVGAVRVAWIAAVTALIRESDLPESYKISLLADVNATPKHAAAYLVGEGCYTLEHVLTIALLCNAANPER